MTCCCRFKASIWTRWSDRLSRRFSRSPSILLVKSSCSNDSADSSFFISYKTPPLTWIVQLINNRKQYPWLTMRSAHVWSEDWEPRPTPGGSPSTGDLPDYECHCYMAWTLLSGEYKISSNYSFIAFSISREAGTSTSDDYWTCIRCSASCLRSSFAFLSFSISRRISSKFLRAW